MTLGFAVKVFFELALILLIVYGVLNEDKLIAFEDELAPVLKFCVHKYILKDLKTKKAPVKKAPVKVEKAVSRPAPLKVISGKKFVKTETKGVA